MPRIALAYLLFGYTLTPVQLAGGVLIIAGVLVAQTGPMAGPSRTPTSDDQPAGGMFWFSRKRFAGS